MISFIEFSFICLVIIPHVSSYILNKYKKPSFRIQTDLSQNLDPSDSEKVNTLIPSNIHPSKIVNSLLQYRSQFGDDWSYSQLLDNIDNNKVSGASVFESTRNVIAIDSNIDTYIEPSNLHNVHIFADNFNDILDKLTNNKINTDVYLPPVNQLSSIANFILSNAFNIVFILLTFSILKNTLFMQNGGKGNFNDPMSFFSGTFGVDESNIINTSQLNTTFSDIAGCDEAKFELMEVVDFLRDPSKFTDAGAKVPTGVLLAGSPGTGKTLLARAVAKEANVTFLSASGSEFIEMFVGVGAARVRKLFDSARDNSPCVVFIDEIDAIGRQRGTGIAGGNDEREQTLNQILTNMDGFEENKGIVVIAATNRIDVLDDALIRPGRFDRKINVPLPDYNGRIEIARVHFRNKRYSNETLDFEELSSLTPGFSGADIANLANEAAIFSVRNNKSYIDRESILQAYEKITIGLTSNIQEQDKDIVELVTYHETGHALMASLFPEFFDVRKVTINANRGGAGGYTLFTPKDRFQKYATKKFILTNLIVAMGGRAAEIYLYNKRKCCNI